MLFMEISLSISVDGSPESPWHRNHIHSAEFRCLRCSKTPSSYAKIWGMGTLRVDDLTSPLQLSTLHFKTAVGLSYLYILPVPCQFTLSPWSSPAKLFHHHDLFQDIFSWNSRFKQVSLLCAPTGTCFCLYFEHCVLILNPVRTKIVIFILYSII